MLLRLMFGVGLRQQYAADMTAVQVHLYKFTRLIHDLSPRVHTLFELHGVDVFLFSVPWFLCCFSSQFPLELALRVLGAPHTPAHTRSPPPDLLLVDGVRVLFSTAVALVLIHEEAILLHDSFEELVGFMQKVLPSLTTDVNAVVTRALALPITDARLGELEDEFHRIQMQAFVYGSGDEQLAQLFHSDPVLADMRDMLTEQRQRCAALQKTNEFLQQQVNHARSAMHSMRLENDACHTALAVAAQEHAALTAHCRDKERELAQLRASSEPAAKDKAV